MDSTTASMMQTKAVDSAILATQVKKEGGTKRKRKVEQETTLGGVSIPAGLPPNSTTAMQVQQAAAAAAAAAAPLKGQGKKNKEESEPSSDGTNSRPKRLHDLTP